MSTPIQEGQQRKPPKSLQNEEDEVEDGIHPGLAPSLEPFEDEVLGSQDEGKKMQHGSNQEKKGGDRYKLLGIFVLVVVAVAVIVVTFFLTKGEDNTTKEEAKEVPVVEPSDESSDDCYEIVLNITGLPNATKCAIGVSGSPQQMAYNWTLDHPEFDEMDNWRKIQLLALATFYYSLNGEAWEDQFTYYGWDGEETAENNWMNPNVSECLWYTEVQFPSSCQGYACGYPSKYHYSGSLCYSSSAAMPGPFPNLTASNCDEDGRFQVLSWARSVGDLKGVLPMEIFLLTSLTTLDLWGYPDITGTIPSEVGMTLLETLDLSRNGLHGSIPKEIGYTNLTDRSGNNRGALALQGNSLTGWIPSELGLLTNLKQINLQENQLSGGIPSDLGRLSQLDWFEAQFNTLSSTLPSELGVISKLRFLDISENQLTSTIPSEIGLNQYWFDPYVDLNYDWDYNLTGMSMVALSGNSLSGTVPAPILLGDQIHLQNNQLTAVSSEIGILPSPSRLLLDLAGNLISSVPSELFLLTTLQRLRLAENQLSELPSEVVHLSKLPSGSDSWSRCWLDLDLAKNGFKSIPPEFAEMGDLIHWKLGNNLISEFPVFDWSSLTHLESISLPENLLAKIPVELFQLQHLSDLDLSSNLITGAMPSLETSCGTNLTSCSTSLRTIQLFNNSLAGPIPNDIGSFSSLTLLNISSNRLTGTIPHAIFDEITNLETLDLSNNLLSGAIPPEVGLTTSVHSLVLANNSLGGPIPSELGVLPNLEVIDFSRNSLHGGIPPELGHIYGDRQIGYEENTYEAIYGDWSYLHTLDLSHNGLTGSIPTQLFQFLTNLQLLELSFNGLTGLIPSELGLLNATRFDNDWGGRYGNVVPVPSQIVLVGNNFSGSMPFELCDWYCNSQDCPSVSCNTTVLRVDCSPVSLLDCSVCSC